MSRLRNDEGEPLRTAAEMWREDELDAEAAFYDRADRDEEVLVNVDLPSPK